MKEPKVEVGILFEPQIEFILLTPYHVSGKEVNGKQTVTYDEGKILWNGRQYDELVFEPLQESVASFELLDVTIGINFHWERKEDQRFQGSLKIIVESGKLTGINVIRVEDYLTSVISSEMSATASLELLKAHAVISRSWLLANLSGLQTDKLQLPVGNDTMRNKNANQDNAANCQLSTADCQLKWYERDSHTHFDVCADDHCQRYQGITRASTDIVRQAIAATRGQVLISEGRICDARFSKCCGGAFEEFQYCWEDIKYPYLAKQRDYLTGNEKTAPELPDLTQESEADRWIRTSPEAFCNTTDKKILSQVLNNYDQETTDFYRWKVDGFIMTNCILAAAKLYPEVLHYAVFGHCGDECGHKLVLDSLNAKPLLHLGLRLGEGTGAICAYPIIESAVRMINEMDNFAHASITKYF